MDVWVVHDFLVLQLVQHWAFTWPAASPWSPGNGDGGLVVPPSWLLCPPRRAPLSFKKPSSFLAWDLPASSCISAAADCYQLFLQGVLVPGRRGAGILKPRVWVIRCALFHWGGSVSNCTAGRKVFLKIMSLWWSCRFCLTLWCFTLLFFFF